MPCTIAESTGQGDHRGSITLDNQLCFAVYKNANKMGRLYRRYLQPFRLTFPLYLVLLVLWGRAPCNVGDIVQALDLETNTVTPLLKRLQRLGYVSRERDPLDERKVTVGLTEQGHALREKAVAIRTGFIDRSEMPYDQIAELRTTLHRLSAIIDGLMLSEGRSAKAS